MDELDLVGLAAVKIAYPAPIIGGGEQLFPACPLKQCFCKLWIIRRRSVEDLYDSCTRRRPIDFIKLLSKGQVVVEDSICANRLDSIKTFLGAGRDNFASSRFCKLHTSSTYATGASLDQYPGVSRLDCTFLPQRWVQVSLCLVLRQT